jgi:signal transduction histidine kinase/CheY-like chemotaxis protein/HPt (histidine-containing phosphotransfer) domain-containing protein
MDATMSQNRRLRDLIASSENWLTARIIHYAKERGYTPFTSTLEQAWLASIRGLSAPLIAALDEDRPFAAVHASADYAHDPIALYGIEAARRHRTRGITLGLFLGLMKSYRETYKDLVDTIDTSPAERAANRRIIDSFFDRMEVGFSDEWSGKPADEQFEQLRMQNRLITNEKNKYLTIFESLKDPVILIGEEGQVENANHAALSLFADEGLPGASYYGGARLSLEGVVSREMFAGEDLVFERLLKTNIGPRSFDIKVQRMLDVSEKFLGAVVIFSDVTEYRRAREDAERADRAKSAFLTTMSHEIRTPIHGILGLADLLLQGRLALAERQYVEAIAKSGQMLSSVVSDILDFSKIEAGALELEEASFSVAAVVEEVFGVMMPLAARKPELRLDLQAPQLPPVFGDEAKLRQILLNLVGNAVKFTERGEVRMTVTELPAEESRLALRFDVIDTGIGIAPDKLEAIFDPFTQSESSVARRYGGSGLGLAICRRFVERLGGEIGVESEVGRGSRFRIVVSFARAVEGAPSKRAEMTADLVGMPFSLDVLVVEDNEVNAMVACGLLRRMGHRVALAATGEAAVDEVRAHDYDVVLMDLRLPDIDGVEATRRIRALSAPRKARVPIVGLSAQANASDVEAFRRAGVQNFLGKPFRLDRLEATLRRVVLRHARRHREPIRKFRQFEPAARGAQDVRPTTERIDLSVLSGHVDVLGFEETAKIVSAFESSLVGAPEEIERMAANGECGKLADVAHRIKSSSLHVGLARLSDAAAMLERQARSEDYDDLVSSAGALAAECRKGLAVLKRSFVALSQAQPANT